MLRQGKAAVQTVHEVEVLTTDYLGEDTLLTNSDLGQTSSHMTVQTLVRGRLHIRTGNIGECREWCWNFEVRLYRENVEYHSRLFQMKPKSGPDF